MWRNNAAHHSCFSASSCLRRNDEPCLRKNGDKWQSGMTILNSKKIKLNCNTVKKPASYIL